MKGGHIQMEENKNENINETVSEPVQEPVSTPPTRRRRPKSKMEIFKETTLPLIILAVAAVLILVFIIGSITRGVQKRHIERDASIAVSESIAEEEVRLGNEVADILADSEALAKGYDFQGAIDRINSFSGNVGGYPELQDALARYEYGKQSLVLWEDPNSILNLSFQTLIADPERAFNHWEWGSSLKKNYITTNEFRNVLQKLYDNNFILVNFEDFVTTTTNEAGLPVYKYKELYLPDGKKPLMLTTTNVNYPLYLVDSDGDLQADQGGVGIASKLVLDSDGSVTCEMVNADGTVTTGAYDFIPILDEFVEEHPDFSYGGAKAVVALTGYNGLFGYRTNADGRAWLGEEQYAKDAESVKAIAQALTDSGYELAYYTYANSAYARFTLPMIQGEMNSWNSEVVPLIGNVEIMVSAQNSDISSSVVMSGDKYAYLKSCGFNYFIGYGADGASYSFIADEYVHQGRLMVTGYNLAYNTNWYISLFDTDGILEYAR